MKYPFASIEQAISDIAAGKMIILVDDEDRENEGDLVIAAEKVTPEVINFMATHGRGLICLPMESSLIDKLNLAMMVPQNQSPYQTAFTVSIEAKVGVTTGISAADRAHTILSAIDSKAGPEDIISPGHIFPLKARDGGVLVRGGQTEGSVDLARLAGLTPASVICEIINDDGSMARMDDLSLFSRQHDIPIVAINDLISYRKKQQSAQQELASARLPIENLGEFTIKVYAGNDGLEHVALIKTADDKSQTPLVRIHSECLTGDVLGSARCDCGWQLDASLKQIADSGGVLLYLRQEGRGIGLANKIKAYALQEQGMDTVEANHHLGLPTDSRDYGIAAKILLLLDIKRVNLLTNNPLKIDGLSQYGIEVAARIPLNMEPTAENAFYIHTKQHKLGHLIDSSPLAS